MLSTLKIGFAASDSRQIKSHSEPNDTARSVPQAIVGGTTTDNSAGLRLASIPVTDYHLVVSRLLHGYVR